MTLSIAGTVVMVVIIAAAVMAMILVLALANRRNADKHGQPHGAERADSRYPGLSPEATQRHARQAGDEPEEYIEPGGHVVRGPER